MLTRQGNEAAVDRSGPRWFQAVAQEAHPPFPLARGRLFGLDQAMEDESAYVGHSPHLLVSAQQRCALLGLCDGVGRARRKAELGDEEWRTRIVEARAHLANR